MLNLDASPIDLCEGLGDSGRTSLSARRTIRTPVDAHGSLSLRPFGGFQPLELTEAGRDGAARQHCTGFGALSPLNFTATITYLQLDRQISTIQPLLAVVSACRSVPAQYNWQIALDSVTMPAL